MRHFTPETNAKYVEMLDKSREMAKAARAVLVAKYTTVKTREFGAKEHATGHVKRLGYETGAVPMPWDWPVK